MFCIVLGSVLIISAFDFQFGTITKWHEKAQYMHAIVLYRQSTCEHNAQITYKAVHLQVPCIRHIWVVKKVPCVGISAGEKRLAKTLNFSDSCV